MSFTSIRHNARNMLNENLQFLNYISSLEPKDPRHSVPLEVNIMKGLFYVHLYSSLEKSINELVQHTIVLINTKSIKIKHYNNVFNSVVLFDKLKAFKDSSYKNFFTKAYDLFVETTNPSSITMNETIFANTLQNVWFETIREVTLCFGVKNLDTSPRTKATINEIVDKRNAVAHGRENAADIGSRYRSSVIRIKFTEISNFIYELIDIYDLYFSKKDYLRTSTKRLYI
ncbi:MAE_28990/MAE_18760 family HEPN-like nuclease [uncultured Chryseobacterium sp.]|uniref:MAE_28990/MAE_18760 family HEPN-like nuclease n=1 Tax=uncultured Chryseobacterium sp. TaxID=259322 RepID=UPI0025CE1AC9|nr:MAE_28990/MAE_18760 family HEPN-like nuclease [uncultured Chryseobacterium sp.]